MTKVESLFFETKSGAKINLDFVPFMDAQALDPAAPTVRTSGTVASVLRGLS